MISRSKTKLIKRLWEDVRGELETRGGSWLPARRRILSIPRILPCETFSSWAYRSCLASGIPIKELLAYWKIQAKPYWVDIGVVNFDPKWIASTVANVDAAAIKNAMWPYSFPFSSWHGLSLSCEPLRRIPIIRYCPECLRTDEIPYIRKAWRLSYYYVCTDHRQVLREVCPRCGKRISLSGTGQYIWGQGSRGLTLRECQHCGEDLCQVRPIEASDYIVNILAGTQFRIHMLMNDALPPLKPGAMDSCCTMIQTLAALMQEINTHQADMNSCLVHHDIERFIIWGQRRLAQDLPAFPIGINGHWLFGKQSGMVCEFFNRDQSLFESTIWLESGEDCMSLRLGTFRRARNWLLSEMKSCGVTVS